jgi:8-oxo-dGTP diphosphatase
VPIYLVRHGHAGSRSSWPGDDDLRPLSERGHRQAEGLAELLDGHPVGAVHSSPALRCTATVAPLADRRGLGVVVAPELAEGVDPERTLRWLLAHAERDPVACSHGDVIPKVIRLLTARGMEAVPGGASKKGSLWVLEVCDGHVTAGTYHPPTA